MKARSAFHTGHRPKQGASRSVKDLNIAFDGQSGEGGFFGLIGAQMHLDVDASAEPVDDREETIQRKSPQIGIAY